MKYRYSKFISKAMLFDSASETPEFFVKIFYKIGIETGKILNNVLFIYFLEYGDLVSVKSYL